MTIKPKMEKAICDQINAEFYSAYLYLSMAAHFESKNLPGFANWMFVQYQEEITHALKFYRYIVERGGKATLKAIDQPPAEWSSPTHAFDDSLKHEELITSKIHALVDLAILERDHATNNMLQWFVTEQVEEEASVTSILEKLKLMGDSKNGLFMMDKELASRVFTDPTANSEA